MGVITKWSDAEEEPRESASIRNKVGDGRRRSPAVVREETPPLSLAVPSFAPYGKMANLVTSKHSEREMVAKRYSNQFGQGLS
jgi:hypothetical protein